MGGSSYWAVPRGYGYFLLMGSSNGVMGSSYLWAVPPNGQFLGDYGQFLLMGSS